MKRIRSLAIGLILLLTFNHNLLGQNEIPKEAAAIPGDSQLVRLDNKVYRMLSADQFPVKIPKFFAPLRRAVWTQGTQSISLDLTPEVSIGLCPPSSL